MVPQVKQSGESTAWPVIFSRSSALVCASFGAGLAADLKTIAAFGHYGVGVITSVTAQNTQEIHAIYDLPMEFVAQQIVSLTSDIEIHAVKIGMLGTVRAATIIASLIESLRLPNVVVDPVLRSTSGTALLEKKGVAVIKEKILPLAHVVTPNMSEASTLTGMVDSAAVLTLSSLQPDSVTKRKTGNRIIAVFFNSILLLLCREPIGCFRSPRESGSSTPAGPSCS